MKYVAPRAKGSYLNQFLLTNIGYLSFDSTAQIFFFAKVANHNIFN